LGGSRGSPKKSETMKSNEQIDETLQKYKNILKDKQKHYRMF